MSFLGAFPVFFSQGAADAQHQVAVLVFTHDKDGNLIAYLERLQRIAQPLKLAARHNTFRLVADVNQHLV
jgi:hypothetical protein